MGGSDGRPGWAVGYDPSVRVRHNDMDKSDVYKSGSVRFNEGRYLQYLCRNFPRVRRWELPFMDVDCEAHVYLRQVPDDSAVGRATRAAPLRFANVPRLPAGTTEMEARACLLRFTGKLVMG